MQSPDLQDLKDLAQQAGAILRAGFRGNFAVQRKGRGDLVTDIDYASETFLIDALRTRFPGHHIVTEESGQLAGDSRFCWYIDPLDGTLNYAHGIPFFSISLAFAQVGLLEFAVVYDPIRDELFSAQRGRGAWLNDRSVRASTVTDLLQSLLTTGFPGEEGQIDINLAHYGRFARLTQGVRRLGSAALELCYVAAGRLEGIWEIALSSYDIAAGALIAREAGAVVTRVDGKPDILSDPSSVLAANPRLHALMLRVLQDNQTL